MSETARWIGFVLGVMLTIGTVIAVMKTLIVPRRSYSFLAATVGRVGYRAFYGVAARMRRFDRADRFLGFEAPTVIILTLAGLLGSFTIAFGLMLLPWVDTPGAAMRESGSSVFTLGFVSTDSPVPTALDVTAGAIGMIFVALTIGYLPSLYAEIRTREALVKQLEAWTGKPSWGPEVLARFTLVGGLDRLPALFRGWSTWSARVADSHMKYPVLTHFRGPRSHNHFVMALLAVADAAAIDIAARPSTDHADARLFLQQAASCLDDIAYPMRRIEPGADHAELGRAQFEEGWRRLVDTRYPAEVCADDVWLTFSGLRRRYAPVAGQLLFWTIAAPGPWTGGRMGFPALADRPEAPQRWAVG